MTDNNPSLLSKNVYIIIRSTIILPSVLYVSETWSLTLRKECRVEVFASRVLRKIFGPKEGRANREVKFYALYSSNIIRVIKARHLRLAGHTACMEERKLHARF